MIRIATRCPARTSWFSFFTACVLATVISAGWFFCSAPLWALDQSKTEAGDAHLKAHAQSTGSGVKVGVVEVGGGTAATSGIDLTKYHFSGRLVKDRFFGASLPSLVADPALATGANAHGTLVSDVIASSDATHTGVAPGADIYAAWIGTTAMTPLQSSLDWYQRNYDVRIFNHSWENASAQEAAFMDWMGYRRNTLQVVAAGNMNPAPLTNPALIYNGLVVGAVDNNFVARASYSDFQPTGRAKPDLVAPGGLNGAGNGINSGTIELAGTSFATPAVTGVAALLAEEGLAIESDTRNRLAQRAIIMNSTRKRYIVVPDNDHPLATDHGTTVGVDVGGGANTLDGDYLTATGQIRNATSATAPATGQWTPEAWSGDGRHLVVTKPLDDELGTGVLDANRALINFNGGEQKEKVLNPGGITPIGWNRTSMTADAPMDEYEFNFGIRAGTFITVTLVWDRPVIETDAGVVGSALDQVDVGDTYAYGALPDFELYIYLNNELLASSIGSVDTVEHLHFPVPEYGAPFEYSLRVDLLGSGATHFNYGLAWWTEPVPEPSSIVLTLVGMLGLALVIGKRLRPDR